MNAVEVRRLMLEHLLDVRRLRRRVGQGRRQRREAISMINGWMVHRMACCDGWEVADILAEKDKAREVLRLRELLHDSGD